MPLHDENGVPYENPGADDYSRQVASYDQQMTTMESQAARYGALLDIWEDQTRRFEAVLRAMEATHLTEKSASGVTRIPIPQRD